MWCATKGEETGAPAALRQDAFEEAHPAHREETNARLRFTTVFERDLPVLV